VDERFQRKLRKGLLLRDRRLTLADEDWLRVSELSPFCGVDGWDVDDDDKALSSALRLEWRMSSSVIEFLFVFVLLK